MSVLLVILETCSSVNDSLMTDLRDQPGTCSLHSPFNQLFQSTLLDYSSVQLIVNIGMLLPRRMPGTKMQQFALEEVVADLE